MSNLPRLGRYELVRKIAAGGMAEIFLARLRGEGGFFRDVVIKRLFRHLGEQEAQVRMFQDEGRLLAELAHPNIPQVYEVGFADGYWYVAMELVDGHTVSDIWHQGAKNGLPMPIPVAIGIVLQICEALHHVHERTDRARRPLRIVHRDVTPMNIMLTRDGVAKLMDFGVALTAARKESDPNAVRGTFAYMAPEQVRARPLDKRADVFALGVILYELSTGGRLFRGGDVQVMTQIVEQDVPPPSTRVPGYPADLDEIVLAALQRDRGRRLPSAAHLAWKLEEHALRHGVLVGPRTVARYVTQVMPAEPVRDEELGIVEPRSSAFDVVSFAQSEPSGSHAMMDDDSFHHDLALLGVPPDARRSEEIPDPLDLPIHVGSEPPISVDDTFDQLLAQDRAARSGAQALALDDFDLETEGDDERPILLLGSPKTKPPAVVVEDSDERAFMKSLERRLSEEDE